MRPATPIFYLAMLIGSSVNGSSSLAMDAEPAHTEGPQRVRLALVVGANNGGPDRLRLHYAGTDAQSVATVLVGIGGVLPGDATLLLEPNADALRDALARLANRLAELRRGGARTEAVVYYSGHSDDTGLLLDGDVFPFAALRAAVDRLPADVRVAILDSCASGTFARAKGGVRRPAFLLDTATQVRGQAILTSSAADESAQESDSIRASYFTHALVSGLRGAADANHDGRVSLNEAYAFSFQETLASTELSGLGAQHPAFAIALQGTGDLVLTDVRRAGATLALTAAHGGQLTVRDADGALVAALKNWGGRALELGVAAGGYAIGFDSGRVHLRGEANLADGARVDVAVTDLAPALAEENAARGPSPAELQARAVERDALAERAYRRDRLRVEAHVPGRTWREEPFDGFVGDGQFPLSVRDFVALVDHDDVTARFRDAEFRSDALYVGGLAASLVGLGASVTAFMLVGNPTRPEGVSDGEAAAFLVTSGTGIGLMGAGGIAAMIGLRMGVSPLTFEEAQELGGEFNTRLRTRLGLRDPRLERVEGAMP